MWSSEGGSVVEDSLLAKVPDYINNHNNDSSLSDSMSQRLSTLETRASSLTRKSLAKERGFWGLVVDGNAGGSTFDGFLLAASQEVGHVILTLPYTFSLVGMVSGVLLQVTFATLALYTNFLLVSLHATYRHRINNDPNHPHFNNEDHIVSYTEVMHGLVGPRFGRLSQVVVYISLIGIASVQIIATASNFYLLEDRVSKRTWALAWGAIFCFMLFIPNFRHYRVMSVFGLLTTTYVSWFMTAESFREGRDEGVTYSAPTSTLDYFRGMVGILFAFGGHSSNVEVADVMDDPTSYDRCYFYSYLYVFTLTIPNVVATYYVYGDECEDNANAFSLYEVSIQRDIGIVMMVIHQLVAFGLFSGPLYHAWEKYWNVHDSIYITKILSRIPVAGFLLLLAVAVPFYGSVNALLGAFATSMATYIIPLIGYNLAYRTEDAQINMVKRPSSMINMKYMFVLNWILAALVFVCGVCIGGTGATLKLLQDYKDFHFFAECYECDD